MFLSIHSLPFFFFDMWILLVFLSILHTTTGTCPDWFDIVKEGVCTGPIGTFRCYNDDVRCMGSFCAYPQNPETDPYNSKTSPPVPGLKPVSIHNYEDQSYWTGMAAKIQKSIFLDLDKDCSTFGDPWFVDPSGNWKRAFESSNWKFDWEAYCVGQVPRLPIRDACDSFSEENDRCYQVGLPAKNWNDAQEACQLTGSELVSIHNEQENTFIHKLAVSKGAVNGLYIGATFSENENGTEFAWPDGSAWDFDNNYAEYPKSGEGDCIAMDTFSSAGKWLNTDCSKKLPYVCARPDTTRQCPSGPWKEGDVITSPGFPYDASIACDYTLTVAPGKFVQVQIEEMQANSCCDNLLLDDGKIGGKVVAKLTGQIVAGQPKTFNSASNFMRVSWQPNGAVNVKGFKMTYRAVDNADEGPLTTTNTTPKLTTTSTTTPGTTAEQTTVTNTSQSSTLATLTPTTSGAADYGLFFIVITLLSNIY